MGSVAVLLGSVGIYELRLTAADCAGLQKTCPPRKSEPDD